MIPFKFELFGIEWDVTLWKIVPVFVGLLLALLVLRRARSTAQAVIESFAATQDLKRITGSVPSQLQPILSAIGPVTAAFSISGVERPVAVLALGHAGGSALSDHLSIAFELKSPAPRITLRPLESTYLGKEQPGGLHFESDPAFSRTFFVEAGGNEAPAARKWFIEPVRAALISNPKVWLRTEGTSAALSIYGEITDVRAGELLKVANEIFKIYGPEGQPELLLSQGAH